MRRVLLSAFLLLTVLTSRAQWAPAGDRIKTKWSAEINPSNVLPEYPRPILERKDWKNLNGLWEYAIIDKGKAIPQKFEGRILVPFAIESSLSGVGKVIDENHVAVLSYQAPEMNKLVYKLEGFDREWYPVDKNALINYSNLPYGTYIFHLKGSNSDGKWNNSERILKIHIRPPFYLSPFAYGIYVVIILLSIAGIIYYFKKKALRKHQRVMEIFEREKERELYAAKIDFFTNVSHEIRTPLTLIKSPLENVLASKYVANEIIDDLKIMKPPILRLNMESVLMTVQ